MKAVLIALAALCSAPALADPSPSDVASDPEGEVIGAAETFFEALRDPDKTALARMMLPEGVIFVHDRRDPAAPKTRIVPAGTHLESWTKSPPGTDEYMIYETVLVDGEMAHVWGPYVFLVDGKPTHCGINSMSLAKTAEGWRVGNTSFTMTALDECEALGAPDTGQ
ncbi:MAG: hypothetical protein AAF707_02990 [Pseudomonadota bacterium]